MAGGAQGGFDAVLGSGIKAAHGAGDLHLGGQHVVAVAAFDAGDRQHGRFTRVDAPGDDGIELRHQLAGSQDGIGGVLGLGRVAALAAHGNVKPVGRRHDGAGARLRMPQRQVWPVVQGVDAVARKALKQSVFDHAGRTGLPFLCRLEDEVHRAAQAQRLVRAHQLAGGANEHAGVPVVPAAVVLAGVATGVGALAQLHHGQRIHVGPQTHAGALPCSTAAVAAALQCAHHASAAHALGHLQAQQAQGLRHDACGAALLVRQLGVGMQVLPQRDQFGQQVLHGRGHGGQGGRVQHLAHWPASTASASWARVWKW